VALALPVLLVLLDAVELDELPVLDTATVALDASFASVLLEPVLVEAFVLALVPDAPRAVAPAFTAMAPVSPTKVARLAAPVIRRARRAGWRGGAEGPWLEGLEVMGR